MPSSRADSLSERRSAPRPTSARGACRADVAERAVGAGEVVGLRRVVARPHPGRGGGDPLTRLGQALGVHLDPPDQAGSQEVQLDGIRQAAGHRLVAHRVDLELQRVAGPLARLGRIADVGRLVVGDRHALAAHDPERRRDDVRRRLGVRVLGDRSRRVVDDGLDVDAVPPSPDPVATEREAEFALDVGRDDRVRLELGLPEAMQGLAAGLEARLLVLAAHEALVRPGRIEDLVELGLGHDMAPRVPVVEHLDSLVQRRAVDDRVMRGERHPQHVRVLELQRTREVVVDLVEAERERFVDRTTRHRGAGSGRLERGQTLLGRRRGRARAGHARRRGQVQGLEHERGHTTRPGPAVVGGVREDELVPGPGHRHVAQASLLGERQFRRGRQPPTETGRQGQGVAPADGREAPGDQPRQEHDRELEPLRLVDR